jgi:tyrosyl-tRNA synthetase
MKKTSNVALKPITERDRIEEVLTRGVGEVIDQNALRQALSSGRVLRVKLGIDPTSPDLHIGRGVLLLKLRDFQELGHQAVLIVGDATGVIGDTSDKESERPMLAPEDVQKNAQTYLKQISTIIDLSRAEVRHNSEWLDSLGYEEIGRQANQFSVADFIARDNIRRRLSEGTRVSLREVLYPLMQGYDSVAVKADVELGGVDQRFNLLAGRTLQAHYGQGAQNIVMLRLIEGLDGRKMSSSWGNTVNFTDAPGDMYGKIMSLRDELVEVYFEAATRIPMRDVAALKEGHPRDMKMRLAREITALYHGDELARAAERSFVAAFQEGVLPSEVPEINVKPGTLLVEALKEAGLVGSKSDYRRLAADGAVVNFDTKTPITDERYAPDESLVLKIGKRRFLRVVVGKK